VMPWVFDVFVVFALLLAVWFIARRIGRRFSR
jgi:hypothetical protein